MPLTIDRFHAEHELSQGNSTVVYAGVDTVMWRPVRIIRYVVPAESSTQILKNVRSLHFSSMTHVHAVHCDRKRSIFSVIEPAPCCTTQLLIDLSHSNPADSTVLHEELIWEIAAASAAALNYLAQQGIAHMNIRPETIYLSDSGIRLASPRLARIASCDDIQGMDLQTLPYIAPEVIAGRGYTVYSDIWSLGATLYTCCTGRPPAFMRTPDGIGPLEQAYSAVSYELAEALSHDLASLIISMLAPLAGARPRAQQILRHPRIRAALERLTEQASFTEQYMVAFSGLQLAAELRHAKGLSCYRVEQASNKLGFTGLMRTALLPTSLQITSAQSCPNDLSGSGTDRLSFDSSLLGSQNIWGKTALLLAIETHNLPLVRVLLQYEGALVDFKGLGALATALTCNFGPAIAAIQGHMLSHASENLELVQPRQESAAVPEGFDDNDHTPLMRAVLRNDIVGVWTHIDKFEGARDASGRTALFHAVENNFLAVARLLATREAGLTSDLGSIALRLCAERNLVAMAALCHKEADRADRDAPAVPAPADVALSNKSYVLAGLLCSYGSSSAHPDLCELIRQCDVAGIFRGLLGYVLSDLPLHPIAHRLAEVGLTTLLSLVSIYL